MLLTTDPKEDHTTLVMALARAGASKALEYLLEDGRVPFACGGIAAQLNLPDSKGNTPLTHALAMAAEPPSDFNRHASHLFMSDHNAVVRLLREAGGIEQGPYQETSQDVSVAAAKRAYKEATAQYNPGGLSHEETYWNTLVDRGERFSAWTVQQLVQHLGELGALPASPHDRAVVVTAFEENGVDGRMAAMLEKDDFGEILGTIKVGDRVRIWHWFGRIRNPQRIPDGTEPDNGRARKVEGEDSEEEFVDQVAGRAGKAVSKGSTNLAVDMIQGYF
eukprot:TRINITY_DN10066_c0_g1_i3.p1 TRINITY_DN10066_c0_g1~~TRINITY_DN10066_c0_g1_i3.p1  ORF type:complete len:277 (+),score=67.82 TRINITY_DN10066_c0_g1_i3:960-1790(+)